MALVAYLSAGDLYNKLVNSTEHAKKMLKSCGLEHQVLEFALVKCRFIDQDENNGVIKGTRCILDDPGKLPALFEDEINIVFYDEEGSTYSLEKIAQYFPKERIVFLLRGGMVQFGHKYPNFIHSKNSPVLDEEEKVSYPNEILNWMYLGDLTSAFDMVRTSFIPIDALLSLVDFEIDNLSSNLKRHFIIKSSDRKNEVLPLLSAIEMLSTWRKEYPQKKILVHCRVGRSRSVSIVVAWLIWNNRWSFERSYNFVRSRRPISKPNDGFIKQLKELECSVVGIDLGSRNFTQMIDIYRSRTIRKFLQRIDPAGETEISKVSLGDLELKFSTVAELFCFMKKMSQYSFNCKSTESLMLFDLLNFVVAHRPTFEVIMLLQGRILKNFLQILTEIFQNGALKMTGKEIDLDTCLNLARKSLGFPVAFGYRISCLTEKFERDSPWMSYYWITMYWISIFLNNLSFVSKRKLIPRTELKAMISEVLKHVLLLESVLCENFVRLNMSEFID